MNKLPCFFGVFLPTKRLGSHVCDFLFVSIDKKRDKFDKKNNNLLICKWLIDEHFFNWTDARRPVPRLWIRSAEIGGDVVRRKGTQQKQHFF